MDRLIPTSNPNALIGYYLGLFSIMPVLGLALGPAGIILGSKGLKAVKQWRFQPSLKDGQPVAVQINFEVQFRLYHGPRP